MRSPRLPEFQNPTGSSKAKRSRQPIEVSDPLFSIHESATYVGLKVPTIRTWVWMRLIPSYRIGRAVRIRRSDLDAVINRGFVPALPNEST